MCTDELICVFHSSRACTSPCSRIRIRAVGSMQASPRLSKAGGERADCAAVAIITNIDAVQTSFFLASVAKRIRVILEDIRVCQKCCCNRCDNRPHNNGGVRDTRQRVVAIPRRHKWRVEQRKYNGHHKSSENRHSYLAYERTIHFGRIRRVLHELVPRTVCSTMALASDGASAAKIRLNRRRGIRPATRPTVGS